MNIEILGIIATIFVLISFILSGEKNIRRVNIFGSLLFFIYGIAINSVSVILLNSCIFVVHLYKLIKISKK